MTDDAHSPAEELSSAEPVTASLEHLVFDGDCGFCSASARFARRYIRTPARIEPWQHLDLAVLGLTRDECQEALCWVGAARPGQPRRTAAGPEAIAALLSGSTGNWSAAGWRVLGRLLATRPVLALAWPAYRWTARNRYRLPGGTPACEITQSSDMHSA